MNARFLLLVAALGTGLAAGGYHWQAQHTQARLESERARLVRDTAAERRLADETARQVAAAQGKLQAPIAERSTAPSSSPSPLAVNGTPTPRPKPSVVPNAELRGWQVQAYVSDQRLRFAALLDRVGFTAEKLQAFDRIIASCQQVTLDDTQPEALRRRARETRDAQLQELFGPDYAQWVEANRNEPARALVAEIVRQTFQSSGALTIAQAEELTRIVAQHRLAPAKEAGASQPRYDWDQIIADAHNLLADRQREDFIAAVTYRRTSEKMSAIAAKKP